MHVLIGVHIQVVVRYLEGSLGRILLYIKHGKFNIEGFSYIDWVGTVDKWIMDTRSHDIVFMAGNVILGKSKCIPNQNLKLSTQHC